MLARAMYAGILSALLWPIVLTTFNPPRFYHLAIARFEDKLYVLSLIGLSVFVSKCLTEYAQARLLKAWVGVGGVAEALYERFGTILVAIPLYGVALSIVYANPEIFRYTVRYDSLTLALALYVGIGTMHAFIVEKRE